MKQAIFMTDGGRRAVENAFDARTRERLSARLRFLPDCYDRQELAARREELRGVRYIFSTWGMFPLTREELADCFPNLEAVFYGAGTVQGFARPFLESGVRVFSAWAANAVPVAEYTVSQIVLAGKGFFQASRLYQREGWEAAHRHSAAHRGNYGAKVGIIGAGMIGRLVISMLKSYCFEVLVFDPFLPEETAAELGVVKCGLDRLFSECAVVSNHLANNEQTKGMLDYSLFSRMGTYATFLNTGRGAQVVEADLIRALREEPGRTAVLDVTWPEPAEADHPFYTMENVLLTPHIAGSMGDEVARMGRFMLEEFEAVETGGAVRYEVSPEMLQTMA